MSNNASLVVSKDKGKDMLDKALRKKGYDPHVYAKSMYLNKAMKTMRFATPDEAYVQLSNGGTLLSKFCNLLIGYYNEDNKPQGDTKSLE